MILVIFNLFVLFALIALGIRVSKLEDKEKQNDRTI